MQPLDDERPGAPRTDRRNSGTPRQIIRSGEVWYPESVSQAMHGGGEPREDRSRRLRPVRDAGLHVERQVVRQRRAAVRRRRNRLITTAVITVTLLASAIAWQMNSDKQAAAQPVGQPASQPAVSRSSSTPSASAVIVAGPRATVQEPTPLLATYRTVQMRLPVAVTDLTEVGYHQASYSYALHLKSLVPDANMTKARADKSTHRKLTQQKAGASARLVGTVLRMWRPRSGRPDTAADVGAKPGSPVLSPVTGTVVLVKRYMLYGTRPDFQVHVQPTDHPELDCVLIHITDPTVKAGAAVEAGITPLGKVRKLSDTITLQLGEFTHGGGNHVHFQLNNVKDPSYKGLKGALDITK